MGTFRKSSTLRARIDVLFHALASSLEWTLENGIAHKE